LFNSDGDGCAFLVGDDVTWPAGVSIAEHLGTVVANTEKEAIAVAIKQPARQNRITVSKISNQDDD
jgi:hypothetical protein